MTTSFEDVYSSVYSNEDLWKNQLGSGLWNNKTICLLGFNDSVESCKLLLLHILKSLVLRGANVLKYPNSKLDVMKIPINYYLCNYSIGFQTKPPNSLDYKLVTPIWLYSCNRDNKIYMTDTLPIFRANRLFNCLSFSNSDLKVSLFGSFTHKDSSSKEEITNNIKYSFDTLHRFIAHCGLTYVDSGELRNKNMIKIQNLINSDFKHTGKLYLLFCKTLDETIDDHVLNLSLSIPCLSIEWLFDSYLSGEVKEIKNYLVSLQKYKNELNKVDLKDFGAVAAYVVNPVYVLAPWALKTSNQETKKMYNNISLVDENRLILFISKEESKHEGKGLFGELSLLVENSVPKLEKNLVRDVKIYNSFSTSSTNFLEVPFELLDGNRLNIFDKNPNFNLYDLADSITFVDVENLSQYEDEFPGSQSTQEIHEMIEEFSNNLKNSEIRWLQMNRSE